MFAWAAPASKRGHEDGPWRSFQVRQRSNSWANKVQGCDERLTRRQSRTSDGLIHHTRRKLATGFDALPLALPRRRTSRAYASEHRAGIRSPFRRPCHLYARTIDPNLSEARQPNSRTLKRGGGQGPVWSSRGGDCRHDQLRAGPTRRRIQSACGARNIKRRALKSAPSGARDRARHKPRSPTRALRGIPAEVGVEETGCGL